MQQHLTSPIYTDSDSHAEHLLCLDLSEFNKLVPIETKWKIFTSLFSNLLPEHLRNQSPRVSFSVLLDLGRVEAGSILKSTPEFELARQVLLTSVAHIEQTGMENGGQSLIF